MNRWALGVGFSAAVFAVSCATSQKVYRVTNTKAAGIAGVHYALPQAIVTLEVPIKKSAFKAGHYARFAHELLGIKAKTANKVSFALASPPTVGTRAEADPQEVFVVQVDGSAFETRSQLIELTERGLLTHLKAETTSTGVDFAVSTLKTAAGIAGRLIFPPGLASGAESALDDPEGAQSAARALELIEQRLRRLNEELDKKRRVFIPDDRLDPNHPETFEDLLDALQAALGTAKVKVIRDQVATATPGRLARRLDSGDEAAKPGELVHASTLRAVHTLAIDPRARNVRALVTSRLKKYTSILLEFEKRSVAEQKLREVAELVETDPEVEPIPFGTGHVEILGRSETLKVYRLVEKELARGHAHDYQNLKIRRAKLITGESQFYDLSAESFELALKEIDESAGEILANFTGKTTVVTWMARFEWSPQRIMPPAAALKMTVPLFDLSPSKGVKLSSKVNGGNPRLLNPATAKLTSLLVDTLSSEDSRSSVRLEFAYERKGQMHESISSAKTDKPVGIYYRIPAEADVRISQEDTTPTSASNPAPLKPQALVAESLLIPQYGVVRYLPSKSGSLKKSTIEANLFLGSGAIQKVSVGSEALPADTFADVGDAFVSIQDAQVAKEKAEEAALSDELTQEKLLKELRRDILLLDREIDDLENTIPESGAGGDE